jgi:hypothetical protein
MTAHTHSPFTPVTDRYGALRPKATAENYPLFSRYTCGALIHCADGTADWASTDLPAPRPAPGLDAALAAIDRLSVQRANSTPRRDQFTVTRREVEALELLASTHPAFGRAS